MFGKRATNKERVREIEREREIKNEKVERKKVGKTFSL